MEPFARLIDQENIAIATLAVCLAVSAFATLAQWRAARADAEQAAAWRERMSALLAEIRTLLARVGGG